MALHHRPHLLAVPMLRLYQLIYSNQYHLCAHLVLFDAQIAPNLERSMGMSQNQSELIRQLQQMRMEKGLTYQAIVDACEMAGEPVSMSSVRRIFSNDPDRPEAFRVTTLQAVARAVIGNAYNAETVPPSDLAALRALLAVREETDKDRQQGIIDRTEQIARMQSTIDELQAEIKRKSKTIKIMILWASVMTVLLIAFFVALAVYVVWDLSHPGCGILR